jgi:hypothetical protein
MRLAQIRAGDVVLVDKKGRLIHGLVSDVDEGGVQFRPLCPNTAWFRAEAREIVGHWRKMGRFREGPSADNDSEGQLTLG